VELPKVMNISELQFNSAAIRRFGQRNGTTPPPPPQVTQTFPRKYTVEVSVDGNTWEVTAHGLVGNEGDNTVPLSTPKVKYLRIKLEEGLDQETENIPWTMKQMKIFGLQ
jgi:hypothetical protein